ncbi:SOS response-associated peptidase [Altericroceibacterium endophyticum]|uniref:Abasic site processing protein n=1 Tax=Altericroceibacterium endophyticum TaxID=1808508 RepID=A0A6I4T4G9_9SPHN|nr:SOS response-associated peptidase family protein [Altericroceibacterium endophyticum]MXO64830.1 hypothetical protein [Altericroceibacterium endophyticum]
MCNLYRMKSKAAEVAQLFEAEPPAAESNLSELVYPGYPAMVVAGGKVQTMHWGFPLIRRGKSGQLLKPKPVNNTRADKLSSPFWRSSFEHRRCLIPVNAFAEAEGTKGAKTKTWISLPDQEIFACAGIWRESEEWGCVFSMVMTEANEAMAPIHSRMPVILDADQSSAWSSENVTDVLSICRPYSGELAIDRSNTSWGQQQETLF